MKKIYTLFVMMCVVLGASANPVYYVDKKLAVTQIEKTSKHFVQEAIRQALAMQTEAAAAPTAAEPVDTVDIVATNLFIDEFEFFGTVYTTVEASNDEYLVQLSARDFLLAGEYTSDFFSLSECVIQDKVDEEKISLIAANLTVVGVGNKRTIVGGVVGENNVLYNLDLSFVIPEATDTVKIVFNTPAQSAWYSESGDYYITNRNEDYLVYLDIIAEQDNFAGEYTVEDFIMTFTYVYEFVDGDTIYAPAIDAKATVTAIDEKIVHVDAELVSKNSKRYMISTDVELPQPHFTLDEKTGSVDKTFTVEDYVILKDMDGSFTLDIYDGANYLALLFYAEKDENTVIPVGTYTIDYSKQAGTVEASSGANDQGQVSYSFYSTMNAAGNLTTPIYFLVSGTVEVSVEGDKLKLEVNAVNSYDVPVHVVCEYQLELGAAVENVMLENGGIRKVVQDNQLYIIKEGVKYDVLGVKL